MFYGNRLAPVSGCYSGVLSGFAFLVGFMRSVAVIN